MYKNCYQLSQGGGGGPEDDDEDCQTETEKDSKSARRGISQKLSNGAGLAALAFGKFGKSNFFTSSCWILQLCRMKVILERSSPTAFILKFILLHF